MKRIKINFTGFWQGWDNEENFICNALRKHFEIEISAKPDFLFVSVFGEPYGFLDYDCVRILYTGEPFVPDFNVFDYAIGFDRISITDRSGDNRYYRYPVYMMDYDRIKVYAGGLSRADAEEALKKKKYFCNFIYSHRSGGGERERILDVLQEYKRVESVGSFLNNQPDGVVVPRSEEKIDFLKQCKFTIACESMTYPGFMTEKVTDCFYAASIPIYYGNPLSEMELNPRAFINLHAFGSYEEALNRIIQIDKNDELYLKMLMEPKFITPNYLESVQNGFEEFLVRILLQKREDAYRRPMYFNRQAEWMKDSRKYLKREYHAKKLYNKAKGTIRSMIPSRVMQAVKRIDLK